MKPSIKLHSIAFALSTAIIFSIWTGASELVQIHPALKITLGALVSLGLYRLLAQGIVYLTRKSVMFKKLFLGPYYLGGTWVGFYIGISGKERFLIERFEQDIDALVIRGKSYDETLKYHAAWTASSVNIDIIKGRISYMYECTPINENLNGNGVAIFDFQRENQYSIPKRLSGFSADLHIGQRTKALEIKISDDCNVVENEALNKAKKLFKENKDKF